MDFTVMVESFIKKATLYKRDDELCKPKHIDGFLKNIQKLDAVMQLAVMQLVNEFLAMSFEKDWDTRATTQLVNQEP